MEQNFVTHSPVDHQLNSNKNNDLHNNHTRLITNDEWDPVALWAEIHRLRAEVQGPDVCFIYDEMLNAVPGLPQITDQEIEQPWYPSASIAEPGKRRVAFGKLQKGSKV